MTLFHDMRKWAPDWVSHGVVYDITALGGRTILALVVLFTFGLLLCMRRYRTAGFVLIATLGGMLMSAGLKWMVDRPRPSAIDPLVMVMPQSKSFPSGHSMNSAVVYLTVAMIASAVIRRWTVRAYLFGASFFLVGLIGVSRLYLGVHYLTDVVAGWLVGLIWAMLCRWIEFRWVLRLERQAAKTYDESSVLAD